MTGVGTKSLLASALLVASVILVSQTELVRGDYWAQLTPWVPFVVAAFAVVASTMVVRYWRLGEPSEAYLRFGDRLPWAGETSLGGGAGRALLVGRASQIQVLDLGARTQMAVYIAVFSLIGLFAIDNRAVALLRRIPDVLERSKTEFCAEPVVVAPADVRPDPACKLVIRAFQLGYAKSLGACAPKAAEQAQVEPVCRKRQLDEPYLHYAWRLLGDGVEKAGELANEPGVRDRLERGYGHFDTMLSATAGAVAMAPRSAHHLFTNLPDPRASLSDRASFVLERRGCGSRLAHLAHFPNVPDGPSGPSVLLEHVLAQLLFNPIYKPSIAKCEEIIVHWGAPADVCAQIARDPRAALDGQDALEVSSGVLELRRHQRELSQLPALEAAPRSPKPLAAARRVVSFQCLMVESGAPENKETIERAAELDGETLAVRETRLAPLKTDGDSQVRLYKHLAEVLAEGFGYGRLTSNQSIAAAPEEATIAEPFRDPALLLTKLDLLRDADLFLGNEWLTQRSDLLAVYPYHLHLKAFIETFRRAYSEHRGRL